MSQSLNSVALAGSTGLVGSQILKTLIELPSQPQIHALSRKPLPHKAPHCNEIIESESSNWPQKLNDIKPSLDTFITALGTTRAQAGSFEAQRKIDHDLNLALAKAAKDNGAKIVVLISSAGTSAKSRMPYSKLKGDVEEAYKELGFPATVIVRPGLLLGQRQDTRLMEAGLRKIAGGLKAISSNLVDFWAQDVQVIARAAVSAASEHAEGKRTEQLRVLEQADIVRLGRTEWEDVKREA